MTSSTHTSDDDLASRLITTLDILPANHPTTFFSLLHDLGFASEDRLLLQSVVQRLVREGRILMSSSDGDIELSAPMMSARLTVGVSTTTDAAMVFGSPLGRTSSDVAAVLTYAFCRHRRYEGGSTISAQRPSRGFRLHFARDGLLARIENCELRPS